MTVLIVEDDPADGLLIRSRLRKANPALQVRLVEKFDQALFELCSGRYQAATIDHGLGVQTGLRLIEIARERGVGIPLILLTGADDPVIEREAMERGASDFLDKTEASGRLLERTIRFNIQRHAASAVLAESERRYEAVVAGSQDGIWDWNLKTGALYLSDRFREAAGLSSSQGLTSFPALVARVHVEDREGLEAAVADHLAGRTDRLSFEYRLEDASGLTRWFSLRGLVRRDASGGLERIAGSQSDVTERKQDEQTALHQSLHDSLTGLANRALLNDRIDHAIGRLKRERDYGFSLMYLDLDGFKAINDDHGHAAGDAVLVETAARLRKEVRAVDCVARVGGDEFVVLLDRCVREVDAERVADAIQTKIEVPLQLGDKSVQVGVSIGTRVVTDASASPAELLSAADGAMYSRKADRKMRGRLHLVRSGGAAEVCLEARLRRALNERLVVPHFQPIVDATSAAIVGFETLARWKDEELGNIPPSQFIPAALRTGVIVELEQQMLMAACKWAAPIAGDLFVSVNVSATHVRSQLFGTHVREALSSSGLDPRRLQLEMTEQVEWENDKSIDETLWSLQDDGVHLVLDDFGTGYSTAEVLARFPVTAVKLSRSLIASAQTSDRRRSMYMRLVELGHSSGATVTAEGVETETELALVREAGATHIQGYMFGRPSAVPDLPAEAAA
ncbi:MAG: EAL domain-containing protein [Nannocystaceae bacterium]|nr:EAL domain-containing protein [Nannocystaceae bacterium]